MKKFALAGVSGIVAAIAALSLGPAASAADVTTDRSVSNCYRDFPNGSKQIHCRSHKAKHREVRSAVWFNHTGEGRLWAVTLSNGALFELVPCFYEDSRNCYWDAQGVGNGIGNSFADVRGTAIYFDHRNAN